jgi:hypothetical protein
VGGALLAALGLVACDGTLPGRLDTGPRADVSAIEAGPFDAASIDATAIDATAIDAASTMTGCPRLGPWRASEPWGDAASHPMPSFVHDDRFYVHTDAARAMRVADIDAAGALGAWRDAGDHGGGPHGFTAVVLHDEVFHFRNGHIATFRFRPDGALDGDVALLEESVDLAFGGNRYVWDVAVAITDGTTPRGVVHLGGFSFTGYEYRPHVLRRASPIEGRFERVGDFPVSRPGNAAYVSIDAIHGFVFARESAGARLFRARVDGLDVSSFEELAALPDGDDNGRGDVIAIGCTLVVIRGARVFVADVASDGALSTFEPAPSLPEPQIDVSWGDGHQEGASWGLARGYVHVAGPRRVYSSEILAGSP